ncbi:MAG TPA: Gfo/Idh/MocA family oxidoreductase, partial [Novosphingobium sp.]|nr:Gfo/Idh/MocA family oxidoreductase [Novosphingobium sp.]
AAIATSRADEVAALGADIAALPTPEALLARPDIDLAVIATPSATHAALATCALEAGKHVVVDKPVALSLAEAQRLADCARAHGRHLFAFHNRRWDSDFLSVRAALAEGLPGRVTHARLTFNRFRPEVRQRWREQAGPGAGVWFDLGPHLVDQALQLFGWPQAVSADIAALRTGGSADDYALVQLLYADKRVVLEAGLHAPSGLHGGPPRIAIHGTQGALVKRGLDPQEAQLVAGLRPADAAFGVDEDPLLLLDGEGGCEARAALRGCQQAFYAAVAEALAQPPGTAGPNRIEEILAVQAVIEAAFTSARQGAVVALAEPAP